MKHLGSRNCKKGVYDGNFGVTLDLPGVTLRSLWATVGDLGAAWVVLSSLWAHFGTSLGSLEGNFCHMAVPLGHLGMILEPF